MQIQVWAHEEEEQRRAREREAEERRRVRRREEAITGDNNDLDNGWLYANNGRANENDTEEEESEVEIVIDDVERQRYEDQQERLRRSTRAWRYHQWINRQEARTSRHKINRQEALVEVYGTEEVDLNSEIQGDSAQFRRFRQVLLEMEDHDARWYAREDSEMRAYETSPHFHLRHEDELGR